MSIVKYRNGMRNYSPTNMSGLLERFFNDSVYDNTQEQSFVPAVDILESEKNYELNFSLPGFEKDSFNLGVEDNILSVSGERKFVDEGSGKTYKSVQTSYGSFKRSFTLPDNVDTSKIKANYNNGILEVVVPKDETKVIKTSIEVK
jgi:HSP20 family protein